MSRELEFEQLIGATREIVFDLFTSPEGQREFYGKDDPGWIVESECDLRVGGVWSVSFGPSPAELYRHDHVFEAIDRPHRLRMTTTETRLDGSRLVFATEFTFAARDERTLMTMAQDGFPTDALREEHGIGVPHALARIERAVPAAGGRTR